MADNILFKTGLASSLPTTKTAGQLLFAIDGDSGSIYYDKDSDTRIKFNADTKKLATPIDISFGGILQGATISFDGSESITLAPQANFNYAGSSSIGGSANSAIKLVDESGVAYNIGDTSKPVFFKDGIPTLCTSIDANATSADVANKLAVARTISLGGLLNGSANFDGSASITIDVTPSSTFFYALSDATGGAALASYKLVDSTGTALSIGDSNTPIYFNNGVPTVIPKDSILDITAGLAEVAEKLKEARMISLDGDATGSIQFDGSENKTLVVTIKDDSHNHTFDTISGIQEALDAKVPLNGAGANGEWDIDITGNAASSDKLSTPITLGLSGEVIGTASGFDGSANTTINTSINVNYAGSSSKGGNANAALKLVNAAGTEYSVGGISKPIYFEKGIPKVCTSVDLNATSASTAEKLTTPRTISLGGDASGSIEFDGSENKTLTVVIEDDSHNHIMDNIDGLADEFNKKVNVDGSNASGDWGINITGKANSADKLSGNITLGLNGDVTGSASGFNGSANFTIDTNLNVNYAGSSSKGGIANSALKLVNSTNNDLEVGSDVLPIYFDNGIPTPINNTKTTDLTAKKAIEANKLTDSRTITFGGDVEGSYDFDGTENKTVTLTVKDNSHGHIISDIKDLQKTLNNKVPLTGTGAEGTWGIGITGNAASASKLLTPISLGLNGEVSGTVTGFDGSQATTIETTVNVKYAGSSTKGGDANAALKLVNASGTEYNIGSSNIPVYFEKGIPKACTSINLNAASANEANKLTTPRTITFGKGASGSFVFDGSENKTVDLIIANDSHNHTFDTIEGLETALAGKVPLNGDGANGTWGIDITGNAQTANQLAQSKTIGLGGLLQGSASFDGTQNITIDATASDSFKYAAADKVNGIAMQAYKLVNDSGIAWNVGDNNTPIYFKDGVPTVLEGDAHLDIKAENAVKADKLAKEITVGLSGEVEGISAAWDGSQPLTIETTVKDNSHNHTISNVTNLETTLAGKADKSQAIYYIEGSGTNSNTWTGSHSDIKAYYKGLVIAYKIGVTGNESQSTLNINNLGAVPVKRNKTGAVNTQYPVGAVLILVYTLTNDVASWEIADYDTNSQMTQYYTDNQVNSNYPLIFRHTAGLTSNTNSASYGRYANNMYVNPSTGTIYASKFNGTATNAEKADEATKLSSSAGNATTPVYFEGGVPKECTSISLTAAKATELATPISVRLLGDITGEITNWTGDENITITTSLKSNYAGSSTKGGAANSAIKLVNNSNTALAIGGTAKPVYFKDGIPVECESVDLTASSALMAGKLAKAIKLTTSLSTTAQQTFDGSADTTIGVSGVLGVGNGGTGISTTPTVGGVVYGATTSTYGFTSAGTSGYLLQSNGSNAPTWINATNANTASSIVKRDASGNFKAGTITASLNGNASTATKLYNKVAVSLTGDVSGSMSDWQGNTDITITTVVGDDTHSHTFGTITGLETALAGKVPLNGDGATGTWGISITGSAAKLTNAQNIKINSTAGDVVTTDNFDGSADVTLNIPKTITGFDEISTKKLTITNTEQVSHLAFSRGGWNYFTAPVGGAFAFVPNGGTVTGGVGATFVITGTTVQPGEKNNTIDLGTSSYKWKNVYATTFNGALSGNASTASKLAEAQNIKINSTAGAPVTTANFDGSAGVTLNIPTSLEGFTSITSTTFIGSLTGSITGNAATATALGSNDGSSVLPVYFTGGKPKAISDIETITITARDAKKLTEAVNIKINATAGAPVTTDNFDGSADITLNIPTTLTGFASITSTSFVGDVKGKAESADILNNNAGSEVIPVYFTGGKPTQVSTSTSKPLNVSVRDAGKWTSAKNIKINGTAGTPTTSANIDGSQNVSLDIPTTITNFAKVESDTFVVNDKVTLQYNTTNECLEFVFA